MATHECSKCLEMTIRDVKESSELPVNTVLATSVCCAAGSGGTHSWLLTFNQQITDCRMKINV